jgi:adenylate kinase
LGTELGKRISACIQGGQLATDEMAIDILKKEILSNLNVKGFIIDGFPRTVSQVPMLERLLSEVNCAISHVFGLEISDQEELVTRITKRGETSNRPQDQDPAVVRERLKVYDRQTSDVIGCYKQMELYRPINGLETVETVFSNIESWLNR